MTKLNIPVLYLICSIIFSFGITVYAWRSPHRRATKSFAVAAFMSVLWMTGDVIERLGQSFAVQWTGQGVCFLGVCFLPVAMLAFIYEYCGKNLSRKWIALLCIIPAISWLMMITNPFHFLFYSKIDFIPFAPAKAEYGSYFWAIHLPYCYILSLVGFAAVLLERQKASPHFRPQISLLFVALCIPLATNALGVFKLFGEATYTPLSFPVFFSLMAFAVFRLRFLKSNPIAYETVFQTISDGVIVLDLENIVTDINPAAAKSLGKSPKSIIGSSVEETFAPWADLLAKYKAAPPDAFDLSTEIELNLAGKQRFISVGVTPLRNRKGMIDGRIFTLRDITDRKHYESSLETMAFYDPLTRLANRRRFHEEAARVLTDSRAKGEKLALIYFDLNHFKSVNDTMGHHVGDELLKYVAARVSSILRTPNLLARLGGDEFAVLLYDCDKGNIDLVVDRILDNVQRPFKIGDHVLRAELSIGAAFYPEDGTTLAELLLRADAAMYQAKQRGGGLALFAIPDEVKM